MSWHRAPKAHAYRCKDKRKSPIQNRRLWHLACSLSISKKERAARRPPLLQLSFFPMRSASHVFEDVHDYVGLAVQHHNVGADDAAAVIRWKRRKLALQFHWARLQ